MEQENYLNIDKIHITGPTLPNIPPTEYDIKKQAEHKEWLKKEGKKEVVICCKNTQDVIRGSLKIGITKLEFDILKNTLNGHPFDRFGRNKYRVKKRDEIDIDALIEEVFEISTLFNKKEMQDFFIEEFFNLVQKENRSSYWAVTLAKFNKKWKHRLLDINSKKEHQENIDEAKPISNMMNREIENYEWDFFISHASEDKEDIALPLYEILSRKGIKVWLDKREIFLGDSLRRKLDEGLAKSRFGIVILSERFFQKEWTKKELDALVSREDGKEKVILPVWHKVDKSIISKYSPLLSDKIAISSDKGLEKVADEIYRTFKKFLNDKGLFFSDLEIHTLNEAIRYSRAREGNFSSSDPLVQVNGKLNSEVGMNLKNYNSTELSVLLNAVDENIKYLNQYQYKGLSDNQAINNKQNILVPLYELRSKISKEI